MLEGLETISWQHQPSASGQTVTIPDLIRKIASRNTYIRGKALFCLHSILCSKGTSRETTASAIPCIIELLQSPSTRDKDSLLLLLAHLAKNYTHNPVRAGIDIYLTLLEHHRPQIRMCATYLLACFPECATCILPKLHTRLATEKNQQARASLLFSLAALLEVAQEPTPFIQLLTESILPKEPHLVRVAAAMALTRLAKDTTPPAAIITLVDTIAKPELIAAPYDELPWATGSIVSDACTLLRTLCPCLARFAIPTLIEALANVGVYSALSITQTLLYLAFNGKKMREPLSLYTQDLTSEQRLVLSAIANTHAAWKFNLLPHHTLEWLRGREQGDRLAG